MNIIWLAVIVGFRVATEFTVVFYFTKSTIMICGYPQLLHVNVVNAL